jgi:hypothetical protein
MHIFECSLSTLATVLSYAFVFHLWIVIARAIFFWASPNVAKVEDAADGRPLSASGGLVFVRPRQGSAGFLLRSNKRGRKSKMPRSEVRGVIRLRRRLWACPWMNAQTFIMLRRDVAQS